MNTFKIFKYTIIGILAILASPFLICGAILMSCIGLIICLFMSNSFEDFKDNFKDFLNHILFKD